MFTAQEFIEEFFKIRNKNSELVPLKFNYAQQEFYNELKKSYGKKPSRFIILKARQLGITTITEAIISYFTMFTPNTSSVLMAHLSESASAIFNMTKLFVDMLPAGMRPKQKYSNAKEIVFDSDDNGLKSSIRVMVASDATRGSTYKCAHVSELAFWEHPEEALLALLQAVPMTDDSLVIIESTANGFNYFYNLWQDAVNGRNDFTPIFFPWYVDPNYSRPYDGFTLSQYEKDIKNKFNLTLDQLQWRRWCIANNCGGDEMRFRQEYPITPEEAFVVSGSSIFDNEKILEHMKNLMNPIKVGYFNYDYNGISITNIRWVNDKNGSIKIYREPDGKHALGADTAGEGSDFFAAHMLNQDGFVCAVLHQQYDPDLFTRQLYCLGKYYNTALLAPETNFDPSVVRDLQKLNYENLYVRKKYGNISEDYEDKYGFRTTSVTRPIIISQLVEFARENLDCIQDRETLQEMLSFVRLKGKPQASDNAHDDLVISLAIALECLSSMPKKFVFRSDPIKNTHSDIKKFLSLGRKKNDSFR